MAQQTGSSIHVGHAGDAEHLGRHSMYRGVITQANVRGDLAQKHVVVAHLGSVMQKIVGEPGGEQFDQRHGQRVARLALHEGDCSPSPVNVGQSQVDDVARP